MRKIIITAGQTVEQIDSVRTITNGSTKELGVYIAELALKRHSDLEVVFLADEETIEYAYSRKLLERNRMIFIEIKDVQSLKNTITTLLMNEKYDSIIHAMSVADFSVSKVFSLEEMIKNIESKDLSKDEIISLLKNPESIPVSSKISSTEHQNITIDLKQTDKIFSFIKTLSPDSKTIVFKNIHGCSLDELKEEGLKFYEKAHVDYVISNDTKELKESEFHNAFIFGNDIEELFSWTMKGNGSKLMLAARVAALLD